MSDPQSPQVFEDPDQWLARQPDGQKYMDPDAFLAALAKQKDPNAPPPGSLQEALSHEGFLDSAWNSIKSMANPFASMSSAAAKDRDADIDKLFAAATPEERRAATSSLLLKHVPFASTLYKLYSGNLGGAAGDVAPLAVAGGAAAGAEALSRIDQVKYSARIFKPGEHEIHFPDVTPEALTDIKTYGNPEAGSHSNPKAGTVADTFTAAKPTIQRLQDAMNAWVNHGMQNNAELDGNILVNATRQAIPDLIWQRDPATANAIISEAQAAFGGRRFPVDRVRDWLRTGNSSKFYSQAGYKQNAAAQAGTAPAIEAAQTNAMRENLYPLLDAANGGAGPREVQSRTSAVIDARNNSSRRIPQVAGEGGATGWEGIANFLTAGARIVGAPFQHQDLATSVRQLGSPLEGKTNGMLRALYRQLPEAPPIPMPPVIAPGGPTTPIVPGYNPRQLPRGTAPFTQGTSAPDLAGQMQRGYGQTINQPPALPPGTAPFTQGTSMPDLPGQIRASATQMLHRPALPEGPGPARIPSPETRLSSPSGDVLDLVAVKDPSTGETHYYPRPQALTPAAAGPSSPGATPPPRPAAPAASTRMVTVADPRTGQVHSVEWPANDTIAIKDPSTGQIHYYPRPRALGQAKGGPAKSDSYLRSIERRAYGRETALRDLQR